MQVLASDINKFNTSFGIKLNLETTKSIAENQRLIYIQKQVELATKKYPKDTLDVYDGYVEYFKNKSNKSLVIQSKDGVFIDKLLESDDNTIINTFVKIAKRLRAAFKMEDETQKRIVNGDKIIRTIDSLLENEPTAAYRSIGEYYAYQTLKRDVNLNPLVYYARFLSKE